MLTRRDALRSLTLGLAAGGAAFEAVAGQPAAPELLIRGARVANADGIQEADVRIVGDTVAEVARGLKPGRGARVIDATGRIVTPGGIDPHTHLHPAFVDDLTAGSSAALAGGITTVGTFASAQAGEPVDAALDRLAARVAKEAIADVILHAQAWPPSVELAAAIARLAERGQPSLKFFMTRPDFGGHLDAFIRLLEAARAAGIVTLVHCEDGAMLAAAVRRLEAEGRTSLAHYAESRPVIAEAAATQQAAALCESTGAPMYVVHLSSARALDACRAARAAGAPLFVETRPMYLHLTEERLARPDAPLYIGQPPLRPAADVEGLWRGVADGSIDVLATDHAPWRREQKLDPTLSIARLRPGVSNLQFMLPMYFSEGVGKRGLPLERFVATTSANVARIFGLYPRKGAIRPGSDADVVIWDPNRRGTIRAQDDHSNADYSVYEGWAVTGWPATVVRRGEIVCEDGRVTAPPGSGRLIPRRPWQTGAV